MTIPYNREYYEALKHPVKDVSFAEVIEYVTGYRVEPVTEEDDEALEMIGEASSRAMRFVNQLDTSRMRVNEVSNRLDRRVREELGGEIPEGRTAGYPNIKLEFEGKVYYLEVKLAGANQLSSTFRTFYYQPSEFKIRSDGSHILVGFIHRNKRVVGWKLVDLSMVNVSLKHEFNTSNIELYKREALIREFSPQSTLT